MRRKVALALACMALAAAPAGAAGLPAAAALARGLAQKGRAEATLRYVVTAPGGTARAVHAMLALEPPDRARIDVPATGEKLVARPDGGEWLQPALRQMLKFKSRQSAAALRWWRVLLAPGRDATERTAPDGHRVLTLLDESGAPLDSAEVWLDAHGLPTRLQFPAGDPAASVYRLGGWRFSRARGEAGFRLTAPPGVVTVDFP